MGVFPVPGPALLFEECGETGEKRRFFACSAIRDRKQCPVREVKPGKGDEKTSGSCVNCLKGFNDAFA
jgi:hypothetical protein